MIGDRDETPRSPFTHGDRVAVEDQMDELRKRLAWAKLVASVALGIAIATLVISVAMIAVVAHFH